MRFIPESEEEQLLLSEALLEAAQNLDEEAAMDERRGRVETAATGRRDADTLRKWHEELEDQEV
jgi:hypothetical protein